MIFCVSNGRLVFTNLLNWRDIWRSQNNDVSADFEKRFRFVFILRWKFLWVTHGVLPKVISPRSSRETFLQVSWMNQLNSDRLSRGAGRTCSLCRIFCYFCSWFCFVANVFDVFPWVGWFNGKWAWFFDGWRFLV